MYSTISGLTFDLYVCCVYLLGTTGSEVSFCPSTIVPWFEYCLDSSAHDYKLRTILYSKIVKKTYCFKKCPSTPDPPEGWGGETLDTFGLSVLGALSASTVGAFGASLALIINSRRRQLCVNVMCVC